MQFTPRLKLKKTLSHPADKTETGLVLGFTGRNTKFGHDCIVLKGDELPAIRDSPTVTHYIVPEEQAEMAVSEDTHIYILDERNVYHVDPVDVSKAVEHTGTKHGHAITGKKIPLGKMKQWQRSQVEVTN